MCPIYDVLFITGRGMLCGVLWVFNDSQGMCDDAANVSTQGVSGCCRG